MSPTPLIKCKKVPTCKTKIIDNCDYYLLEFDSHVQKCAAKLSNRKTLDSFPETSEISIILSFSSAETLWGSSMWNRFLRANIMQILLNQFDHKPVFLRARLPLSGRQQMCSWGFRCACISPENQMAWEDVNHPVRSGLCENILSTCWDALVHTGTTVREMSSNSDGLAHNYVLILCLL